jgi:phage I-like protein
MDHQDIAIIELMSENTGGEQLVHLLPAGTFRGRDGRGPYHLRDPQAVIHASRESAGQRLMPIDYDHQIDFTNKNGRPAPAAGWIKGLQARSDGIWGIVDWTQRAAAHLEHREYRYLSPAFKHAKDGEVTCILRAALTNNPNLDQLTALARREEDMDDLAELRTLLELPDDADIAAIVPKVRDLMTARHAAAETPDPAKYVPIGDFQRAVAEVNRLNQGISLQAAAEHVRAQITTGQLPPFLKKWGVSLCSVNKPAFDAFIERTKGFFGAITSRSPARAMPPAYRDGAPQLTDDEFAIASRMGVSAADFAKNRTQETK